MKALILSAGQGKRLLPLTASTPKCLLPVRGKPILQWQIEALSACGVRRIRVVVGFGAELVKRTLASICPPSVDLRAIDNPLYTMTDNLFSCWMARAEMSGGFVLLNGDTLFEYDVLRRLLASDPAPVTIAASRKESYDSDDMKICAAGSRLLAVGKDLPPERTTGESIGALVFRGAGPQLFRQAVESAVAQPGAERRWYLSVINEMAQQDLVRTVSVEDLAWAEIDFPADLERAAQVMLQAPARAPRPQASSLLQPDLV